jgi:hypothetical protein
MKSPIRAGDLCEVVDGVFGKNSPNLGLVVKVLYQQGEHTLYGVIWLCKAEHAIVAQPGTRNISPDCAHFAQSWLRKIEPPVFGKAANDEIIEDLKIYG